MGAALFADHERASPMNVLKGKLQRLRPAMAPLLVAALLRVTLMIAAYVRTGTRVLMQGDTSSYLEPGRNLILHGAFAKSGLPEIDRTLGYPIFAEITGMAWDHVLLSVLAQIAVSLISLLLVFRLANRLFPQRNAGVIAAWLYALEPLSIVSSVRLMPETLFVALLLVFLDRLLTFLRERRLAALVAGGVFLAAATYVRPASYYLVFAVAVGLACAVGKRDGLWWKAPAVLLASVLPWLAAWQLRNSVEAGYSGFSSVVEKNLYFFQSAEVSAELEHISLAEEQKKLGYPDEANYLAVHPEQRQWSLPQRLRFMRAHALEVLSEHRALYLKTHLAGVGVVAFSPGATELLQLLGMYPADDAMPHRIVNEGALASLRRVASVHPEVFLVMALFVGYLLLLYVFAIVGSFKGTQKKTELLAIVGVAAYFLLISGGAQAVARYRLPIVPELCILAGGEVAVMRQKQLRGSVGSPAEEVISRVRR